jgi:hypothetical protein
VFGEDRCPNKDGIREIHAIIQDYDVVIITTPIYALQVTALVKIFLERSAYIMHRPCYFGKWFMSISTQAIFGDKDVAKYLTSVMHSWGFNIIPSLRLTIALGNQTAAQKNKTHKIINANVKRFRAIEKKSRFPVPKWKDFMMFRVRRSVMNSRSFLDIFPRDVEYFRENNWFKAPYYYDIHINPFMKVIGRLFDVLGRKMIKSDSKQEI